MKPQPLFVVVTLTLSFFCPDGGPRTARWPSGPTCAATAIVTIKVTVDELVTGVNMGSAHAGRQVAGSFDRGGDDNVTWSMTHRGREQRVGGMWLACESARRGSTCRSAPTLQPLRTEAADRIRPDNDTRTYGSSPMTPAPATALHTSIRTSEYAVPHARRTFRARSPLQYRVTDGSCSAAPPMPHSRCRPSPRRGKPDSGRRSPDVRQLPTWLLQRHGVGCAGKRPDASLSGRSERRLPPAGQSGTAEQLRRLVARLRNQDVPGARRARLVPGSSRASIQSLIHLQPAQ